MGLDKSPQLFDCYLVDKMFKLNGIKKSNNDIADLEVYPGINKLQESTVSCV